MVQPNPGATSVTLTGSEIVDILGLQWQQTTTQSIANLAGASSALLALNNTWTGTNTINKSSATAFVVGPNGTTNPTFTVATNTASGATGLKITNAAAAGGLAVSVTSSGTDENLTIDAKGAGTITLNGTGTGAITLARATGVTGAITGTSASANALAVGRLGATTPAFNVDASTPASVTGLNVASAAAAAGVAVSVTSSGTNENLTINAKGSGTVTINGTATGNIVFGKAVTFTGSSSGTTTVAATAAAAGALTLPAVTGTIQSTTGANLNIEDIYNCTASVTANNTTTYANVTGLSGTVVIGTYQFEAVLPSTVASGTGGIKFCFKYTTTVLSSLESTSMGYTASAVAVQHVTNTADQTDLFTQAAVVMMTIVKGTFVVSTGGTIAVQVAQNTANASNSIALLGGALKLTRIA